MAAKDLQMRTRAAWYQSLELAVAMKNYWSNPWSFFESLKKRKRKKIASSPWPGARFTDYLLTIWESRDVVLRRSFEPHLCPVVPCLLSWWCVTSALSYRKDIPDQCSPNSGQRVNTFDYKCWVNQKYGSVLFIYLYVTKLNNHTTHTRESENVIWNA